MTHHRLVHLRRNRAEVLTDDDGSMAVRFNREDRKEFVLGVGDEDALRRWGSVRDPVKAAQADDVVETEHIGEAEVMRKHLAQILVAGSSHLRGNLWWQAPILAESEKAVRRCTARHAIGEEAGVAPCVKPIRVTADRQIQVELLTSGGQVVLQVLHLLVDDLLGREIEGINLGIVVVGSDRSRTQRFGPLLPWALLSLMHCSEASVLGAQVVRFREIVLTAGGDLFQQLPFELEDIAVLHRVRAASLPDRLQRRVLVKEVEGRRASFGGTGGVDVELVPEQAADRAIGAR